MSATTILPSATYFWIGVNDLETEGEFQYATGGNLVYSNWKIGQPDNDYDKQDCVLIYTGETNWIDHFCSYQYPSICEMI